MKPYREMMQHIKLSPAAEERIRQQLIARCAQREEKTEMKVKRIRKPMVIAAAAVLCCALTATAFASGAIGRVYHYVTNSTSYHYENEDGTKGSVTTLDTENLAPPAEEREGRLYLTVNGQNLDITDQCSLQTPYLYDFTGTDGLRHAFIIGGTPENFGWGEFLWNEEGFPEGGSSSNYLKPGSDTEWADWYLSGMEQLDLPWASVAPQN